MFITMWTIPVELYHAHTQLILFARFDVETRWLWCSGPVCLALRDSIVEEEGETARNPIGKMAPCWDAGHAVCCGRVQGLLEFDTVKSGGLI